MPADLPGASALPVPNVFFSLTADEGPPLLKIAFITEACSAGVGRHVIDVALCLAQAGHDIHVLHSLSRVDSRFAVGLTRLSEEGAHVAGFDIVHAPGRRDISAVREIRAYLLKHGPFDVAHCHSTKAGLIGRLAALGLPLRVVYTPHAFYSMSPQNGFLARSAIQVLELSLSLVSDLIICVSDEERAHAERLGISSHKLRTVLNGIDEGEARRAKLQRSDTRQQFGLQPDDVCIGFVGRLVAQKDPELLLTAFLSVLAQIPRNIRMVIVGDGPLMAPLSARIAEAKAGDRVLLAGHADGLSAMSAFDVFALPSLYEGFPYVLLEALALGLPIVATAVGGVHAMATNGENGFVVPPGDARRLAQALLIMCTNPELRTRMADRSLSRSQRFSSSRMVTETEMAYKQPASNIVRKLNQPIASRSSKTAITD
jgi:glycosyltransferase involved in cell wall biosynthesis